MKKRFFLLLTIIVFMFPLVSCGKDPSTRIAYDLKKEPVSLDPQSASDEASFTVINNLFEGLLTTGENGQLQNGLAESYQVSDDELTYTFTLRKGLKWSNGYPLTADDFVYGFQRLFDPSTRSETASSFFCIKNSQDIYEGRKDVGQLGVTALSDTQLKIELEYANSLFLQLLTTAPAMPCNRQFFEETKGTYGLEAESSISTGPFSLYYWAHDDDGYLKLVNNEEYYDKESVKLTSVVLWTDVDEEEYLSRLKEETTHAYFFEGPVDSEIEQSNDFYLQRRENTVWGIAMNLNDEQLKNKNLRMALAYCFDRSRFAQTLPDYLTIAKGLIPSDILLGSDFYREQAEGKVSLLPDDPEAAKAAKNAALAEMGVSKLKEITLLVPKDTAIVHQKYFSYISQVIQRDLNIFISVNEVSEKEWQQKLESGDFDLAVQKVTAAYNHPLAVLNQFSENENIYGYQNGEYNRLTQEILLSPDIEQTLDKCIQAEKMLIEDSVLVPMYQQSDFLAINREVEGLFISPHNGCLTFRYAGFQN